MTAGAIARRSQIGYNILTNENYAIILACVVALGAQGGVDFEAGADLRIRAFAMGSDPMDTGKIDEGVTMETPMEIFKSEDGKVQVNVIIENETAKGKHRGIWSISIVWMPLLPLGIG